MITSTTGNSTQQQERIGYTAKSPRWAIAYKYQAEQALTQLISTTFQVGRTGTITPVANLQPVQLSGSTVRRATLHNRDFVHSLDLHEHDFVYVEKGGEIIPKITSVDLTQRQPNARAITFPTHCPDCGTELISPQDEVAIYCPNNYGCPTQIKSRIEHFCARKAANINIGPETIDQLHELKLITNIDDLFTLTADDLAQLDGFKDKSINNLLLSIHEAKSRPFAALLFGLGIKHVGETTAKSLAKQFQHIDQLLNAKEYELTAINDIGDIIAQEIIRFTQNSDNQELVSHLLDLGVQLMNQKNNAPTTDLPQPLEGKSIVISGTVTHHSRDEYKDLIERYGGKNVSAISSKTNFLLAGEKMGPAKLKKAESLGIDIINEQQFLDLINLKE